MNCLWLEEQRVRLRNDVRIPQPADNHALVRVDLAGICGTDLELQKGYYPFCGIPGHEFVGRVETGGGTAFPSGQRVVGDINLACRSCEVCRDGRPTHCPHRTVLGIAGHDGAFAEYLTLPVENLHAVPGNVSNRAAVFCEPLAAAIHVLDDVEIHEDTEVLLVGGGGRLGLLIAQVVAATPARLTVVVRQGVGPALLADRGIRTLSVDQTQGLQADVVVDATRSPQGFALSQRLVRPAGTLVMKSTFQGAVEFDVSALVVNEVRLVGSRCGDFRPALKMLAEKTIETDSLVSACYPLSSGEKAFRYASQDGVCKVLLECS